MWSDDLTSGYRAKTAVHWSSQTPASMALIEQRHFCMIETIWISELCFDDADHCLMTVNHVTYAWTRLTRDATTSALDPFLFTLGCLAEA